MTPEELALMDDVRAAYLTRTKIGCTGCRYCMPCPNGVDIPGVFSIWNNTSLYGTAPGQDWRYNQMREKGATPENCVACGACEAACPQHLGIIDGLKTAWAELGAFGTQAP